MSGIYSSKPELVSLSVLRILDSRVVFFLKQTKQLMTTIRMITRNRPPPIAAYVRKLFDFSSAKSSMGINLNGISLDTYVWLQELEALHLD